MDPLEFKVLLASPDLLYVVKLQHAAEFISPQRFLCQCAKPNSDVPFRAQMASQVLADSRA